jgi:hypothetical protein
MANTAGLCTSFKKELLLGAHQFDAVTIVSRTSLTSPTKDTFNFALYQTSATIGPATTVYTSSGEVATAGGYSARGVAVTNANGQVTSSGTTGYWTPSASASWTGVSFTTDCALLFNATQGDRAVGSYTFSSQTVSAGNFTLTMPTHAAATALIQIA